MEINKLAKHILEYESDTFSMGNANITETELNQMLDRMYDYLIDNEIDGVWLSGMLDKIRDDNDANCEGERKWNVNVKK